MALSGKQVWKEVIIITDESGREFDVDCGWGVKPPIAYIPELRHWKRCAPNWLWDRRDEFIQTIEALGHVVRDGPYPDYRESPS